MAGTLVTQLTSSNSAIHTNYFDALINQNTNFMALDLRKTGIYSGGYLTRTSDSNFSLSPLTCEIQDSSGSGNQIRLVLSSTISSIPVTNTTPPTLVVLRWTYTTSSSANYPSIYTVPQGSQNATDLIIGTAMYTGSTLSADYGVQYPLYMRSDPSNILDLGLKVENVSAMPYALTSGILVRYGRVSYGANTVSIPTQVLQFSTSLTSGYYQSVPIQINSSGALTALTTGTQSVSSSPTPPAYGGLITIAEVTVNNTGGSYYVTAIKDVRCFSNAGVTLNGLMPTQTGYSGYFLETNGTNPYWAAITINGLLPSQTGNNGYFLATTGASPYWTPVTIDGILPSQATNIGKYLVTNGTNAYWGYSNAYYAA